MHFDTADSTKSQSQRSFPFSKKDTKPTDPAVDNVLKNLLEQLRNLAEGRKDDDYKSTNANLADVDYDAKLDDDEEE